ncbi:MAG: hypothetical protein KY469_06365 [Actinobacteria bacterium]|nr:hypothetical protein [Actinomycetota bacterium]
MTARRRILPLSLAVVAVFVLGLLTGRTVVPSPKQPDTASGSTDEAAQTEARSTQVQEHAAAEDHPSSSLGAFDRTKEGAIEAATAYGLALDGPGLLDPVQRHELLDEFAATEAEDELRQVLEQVAVTISTNLPLASGAGNDMGFVWRTTPAGWTVRAYSRDRARIAIWATGIVMAGGQTLVQPAWSTTEVELVWERGRWRLVGFLTSPGPEPPQTGEPGGIAIAGQINEFQPYDYVPRATSFAE